jgi:putative ABC transport system permease protein
VAALLQDVRYGARILRKNPGFSLIAVITLALGIGANTAIFSVANAVLLRPLPYVNPDRLVFASVELRKRNVKDWALSNADFFDLRNGAKTTFESMAAVSTGRSTIAKDDGTQEHIRFAFVTPNFFRLLGAKIAFGRDFVGEDGQPQPTQPLQQQSAGAAGAQAAPPPPYRS